MGPAVVKSSEIDLHPRFFFRKTCEIAANGCEMMRMGEWWKSGTFPRFSFLSPQAVGSLKGPETSEANEAICFQKEGHNR